MKPLHFMCTKTTSFLNGINEAAYVGNMKTVEELIKRGVQVDLDGRTALHWAVAGAQKDIINMLLNVIDKKYIDMPDNNGYTPFLLACAASQLDIVQILVFDYNANTDATSKSGGQSGLHFAVSKGSRGIAELLLDRSPDLVHSKDSQLQTPLHRASSVGTKDLVELLIQRGAKLSKDIEGNTPLHLACEFSNSEIVLYFIQNGQPMDRTNKQGQTPIDCCPDQFRIWLMRRRQELNF